MSAEAVATKRIEVNQPLESSIQIGLAALLVIGCLLIVKPFVPLLLWAIIITIASLSHVSKAGASSQGQERACGYACGHFCCWRC